MHSEASEIPLSCGAATSRIPESRKRRCNGRSLSPTEIFHQASSGACLVLVLYLDLPRLSEMGDSDLWPTQQGRSRHHERSSSAVYTLRSLYSSLSVTSTRSRSNYPPSPDRRDSVLAV
ncbi:hypothetical protein PsYK624_007400 [Phanerochaete sordida]|uniref:Uncharacterized protein n=1 Tax=Phanerochaete sordida TaxID=48140 RepID=A0A9P3FYV2_9APHY|nr:hypothetical protein PsYK624_007400 [Phanerochaete sordida]